MAKEIVSAIYKIENTVNGKCYIGSAANLDTRWRNHKSQLNLNRHHSIRLQRSWNKCGSGVFVFSVVELVNVLEDLIQREQFWIDALNPWYNIAKTAGSQLGFRHSDKSKLKMSASHKLTPPASEETKRLRSLNHRRHQTEETKKKIGDRHRGRKCAPHSKESIEKQRLQMVGRKQPPRSAEHSRKISEALKGRKVTPERLAKMALARTGIKHSEETKRKLAERAINRDPECYERMIATRARNKALKEAVPK